MKQRFLTKCNSATFFIVCIILLHLREALNEHLAKFMQCKSNHSCSHTLSALQNNQYMHSMANCFYSHQALHFHKTCCKLPLECSKKQHYTCTLFHWRSSQLPGKCLNICVHRLILNKTSIYFIIWNKLKAYIDHTTGVIINCILN